jgi:hypothetical protein
LTCAQAVADAMVRSNANAAFANLIVISPVRRLTRRGVVKS